jgi:hypothetical protein
LQVAGEVTRTMRGVMRLTFYSEQTHARFVVDALYAA